MPAGDGKVVSGAGGHRQSLELCWGTPCHCGRPWRGARRAAWGPSPERQPPGSLSGPEIRFWLTAGMSGSKLRVPQFSSLVLVKSQKQ